MSIFKRFSALALSLVMVLSCGSMAFAAEDNTTSLEAIFEEAKAEYMIAPLSDAKETKEMVYEEIELEDGNKLIVEGYPTDHMVEGTVLEEGEEAENYVYSLASILSTEDDWQPIPIWGYLISTIKYVNGTYKHEGVTYVTRKIDSFSYDMGLNNGYTMSSMKIRYYSFDNLRQYSVDKTITVTQLVMTNYPTTSLKPVIDDPVLGQSGGLFSTGIQYKPVINGKTYSWIHSLVD